MNSWNSCNKFGIAYHSNNKPGIYSKIRFDTNLKYVKFVRSEEEIPIQCILQPTATPPLDRNNVKRVVLKVNLVSVSSYRRSVFHKCVNTFRDHIKAVCTTALIHYSVSFATVQCKHYIVVSISILATYGPNSK